MDDSQISGEGRRHAGTAHRGRLKLGTEAGSFDLVIRGGTVVTAEDQQRADVGIVDGRIAKLDVDLPRGREEIDARGHLVLPGGVDAHTHLDVDVGGMTTVDDFDSGTAAAACGGVTTICDYAWQRPGQTLAEAIATWQAKAAGRAHIDYSFHLVLSEATPERLSEVPEIVRAGYPSFKVFMISEFTIGDAGFLRLLEVAGREGAVVNVHAENGAMLDHVASALLRAGRRDPGHFAASRPAVAEAEATRRALAYAALVGAEVYIVHLSCRGALEAVQEARARGQRVWAETRPIYLGLTEERYAQGGLEAAKVVGAPPLRSAEDQAALWEGLRRGDLQTIGSDNTSWSTTQKAAGLDDFTRIPYGVPGLETEMRVIYSEGVARERISIHTFVSAFSTMPAKIFGLYPRKGTVAVGSDADLVLFNPRGTERIDGRRLHSRAGYDPFDGLEVHGIPVLTISRGEIIARDGELRSRPGRGRHLLRRR
jgi:dihydropyrimidinase